MSKSSARLALLSKQSMAVAAAASASATMTGAASAELITIDLQPISATTSNNLFIDVAGSPAPEFMISVNSVDRTVKDGVKKSFKSFETAIISSKVGMLGPVPDGSLIRTKLNLQGTPNERGIFVDGPTHGAGALPYARRFEQGETVGPDVSNTSGAARIYDDFGADGDQRVIGRAAIAASEMAEVSLIDDIPENFGNFAEEGEVGYLGFYFDLGPGDREGDENGFELLAIEEIEHDGEQPYTNGEDGPRFTRYFGWLEIARGSVVATRIGIQTTPGMGALIPIDDMDIPEPASLPLMALGAAGLAALRRKRAA